MQNSHEILGKKNKTSKKICGWFAPPPRVSSLRCFVCVGGLGHPGLQERLDCCWMPFLHAARLTTACPALCVLAGKA